MGSNHGGSSASERLRPLSFEEIDRRITVLAEELAGEEGRRSSVPPERVARPRWIAPGELIHRLRPFLGDN